MRINSQDVVKYIGGQMEVQNQHERYFFRGQISKIEITEGNELTVTFDWLAKAVEYPLPLKRWVKDERTTYTASLDIYSVIEIGDGRLSLNSYITHELVVLFPPKSKSKLDPSKIEGFK